MSFDLGTYKQPTPAGKSFSLNTEIKLSGKFTEKRKEMFYRELCLLLKSGVDFKKALEILGTESGNKIEQETIANIKAKVIEGKGIHEAMRLSGHFSAYEYYSVQIGEETRKLEAVLAELQKFFARKIQMKRQIVSVITYPAIVMAVTIGVLYFMLDKVVPMFSNVFRQFGSELPKSTQIIIRISNHSGTIFIVLFGVVAVLAVIHKLNKNKMPYRAFTSGLMLRIPFFGNLVRKIYLSRFCQAMSLLTASRTALIPSLTLTSKMIRFYPIESAIETIKQDVTKGVSLSDSMRKHPVFEKKMVSMIDVAEHVNELDTMFERLSEQYNEEVSHQTKMIGVVVEPLIIIIIGVIVGVIMVSMYAPMFDLSKIIKN